MLQTIPNGAKLDPIETASRDEISALQLQRLKWTLQHAYDNVPHTRQFDAAGVHPGDLKTLADLARFPFTTKQDLRANYPFGMFAVPREQVARIHASSGTTGKPTVVGYTLNDIDHWANLVARSIRAAGGKAGRPGACSLWLRPVQRPRRALRRRTAGLRGDPDVGRADRKQVQLIQDFRPDIIMVTPSYMLAIADEFERQGLNPAECSLRIGIHGAEPWTEQMRAEIEQRMGISAVDIYGLSEVMGPGVANECAETRTARRSGKTTSTRDHRPRHRRSAADGSEGELVFYLADQGKPSPSSATAPATSPGCCRPRRDRFRRMGKITGRSDDMLIIRGVRPLPLAGRGTGAAGRTPVAALHAGSVARRPHQTNWRCWWS